MAAAGATTQAEIVEVKDFTLTMMLCHAMHGGSRQQLRVCAQRLAVRFRERHSKDIAMRAFFADNPTQVIYTCIDALNSDPEQRDALKELLR